MTGPDAEIPFMDKILQERGVLDLLSEFHLEPVDLKLMILICILQGIIISHNRGMKVQLVVKGRDRRLQRRAIHQGRSAHPCRREHGMPYDS